MSQWSRRYSFEAQQPAQKPIYVMLVGASSAWLKADATAAATLIQIDADHDFTPVIQNPLLVWDDTKFELARVDSHSEFASTDLTYLTRGQYGTDAAAFTKGRSIMSVRAVFSTGAPSSTGNLNIANNTMMFPSGAAQTLDLRAGRLSTDRVSVAVIDEGGNTTSSFRGANLIGQQVVILGGYEGMAFKDYSFLHIGRIGGVSISQGAVYHFDIDDLTARLSKKLFEYIEDLEFELNGPIDAVVTDIPLSPKTGKSTTFPGPTFSTEMADGKYAGHYMVIEPGHATDEEWVRVHEPGTDMTVTVVRGQLGTSAVAHSNNDDVKWYFIAEDNPVDLVLGLILSRDGSVIIADNDPNGYDYTWSWAGDADFGLVGLDIPPSEIDFTSFEAVREWFVDYRFRIAFGKGENIKTYIENQILSPLGMCFFITNTGKLGLMMARPPITGDTVTTFDDDSIIGVPDVQYTNKEMINEVTLTYDWDMQAAAFATGTDPVTLLDTISQATYDIEAPIEIECKPLMAVYRGAYLAPRICRRKKRHFTNPNPTITVPVLMIHAATNPGDIVRLNYDKIPDQRAGVIGWDKYMLVVGKRNDWSRGALEFDLIDSTYFGGRYGLIAPSGTADYTSASTTEKDNYVFASDTTTEKMSDGADGYLII